MFGLFQKAKNALTKGAMKMAMGKEFDNLPPAQRDAMIKAIQTHPEFFKKIADEIKAEEKKGVPQMYAHINVMSKYQAELQKILGEAGLNPQEIKM